MAPATVGAVSFLGRGLQRLGRLWVLSRRGNRPQQVRPYSCEGSARPNRGVAGFEAGLYCGTIWMPDSGGSAAGSQLRSTMSVGVSVSWATSHHFFCCGLRNGRDNE